MSDAEMQDFLKATFGVESCDLKASTLFSAATSSTSSVWASVRAELKLAQKKLADDKALEAEDQKATGRLRNDVEAQSRPFVHP